MLLNDLLQTIDFIDTSIKVLDYEGKEIIIDYKKDNNYDIETIITRDNKIIAIINRDSLQ